jgi:para-aminobenzoate synthetase component I
MAKSMAVVAGQLLTDPVAIAKSPAEITNWGHWVVLADFEGEFRAINFANSNSLTELPVEKFQPVTNWSSSLSQAQYLDLVLFVQEQIQAGEVYQVNLCRILTADLNYRPNAFALWQRIDARHKTKFSGFLNLEPGVLDEAGYWLVSASPELFLEVTGEKIVSAPIKGTAVTAAQMLEKDKAENVMITDMVRNDLGQIAKTGSVKVEQLLHLEQIPGMVQLVSTVSAQLKPGTTWSQIFDATFPPASVTGAPKLAAQRLIKKLEPVARLGYCGAFGLIQGDTAQLAVGIRSFEYRANQLRFGTGAGITVGSDPAGEWQETELKAKRLIQLASEDD